jgi:hypothetical protein
MNTVQVQGLDATVAYIRGLSRLPRAVLDDMAAVAHEEMRRGAARHSPRPGGTGNLYRSLFINGIGSNQYQIRRTVGHDGAIAPYAQWVLFGSQPHEIKPKNAVVLSWIGGPGFNQRIFAKRVWHPGYVGDDYREVALRAAIAEMSGAVSEAIKVGA